MGRCGKISTVEVRKKADGKPTVIDCRKKKNRGKCDRLIVHCPSKAEDQAHARSFAHSVLSSYRTMTPRVWKTFGGMIFDSTYAPPAMSQVDCKKRNHYTNMVQVTLNKATVKGAWRLFWAFIKTKKGFDKLVDTIYAGSTISYQHIINDFDASAKRRCPKTTR